MSKESDHTAPTPLLISDAVTEVVEAITRQGQHIEVDAPPFAFRVSEEVLKTYNDWTGFSRHFFKLDLIEELGNRGFSLHGPWNLSNLQVRRNRIS